MSWQKTDTLLKKRFKQQGLASLVEAGRLCQEAEKQYPHLFQAISVRNNRLHLRLEQKNLLAFKMIEGKLLEELNQYAEQQELPQVKSIRLTFSVE